MRREAGIYPEGEIEEIHLASGHHDQSSDDKPISLSAEARRDLDYINSSWDVENKGYFISSHRPVAGKFLVTGRELVHGEVRRYVDPAIWKQREFNASTTRFLNEVASSVEEIAVKLADLEGALLKAKSELLIEMDSKVEQSRISIKEDFEAGIDRVVADLEGALLKAKSELLIEMDSKVEQSRISLKEDFEAGIDRVVYEMENELKSTLAIMNEDIKNKAWLAELLERKKDKFGLDPSRKTNDVDINYFLFNDIYGGTDEEIRNNLMQHIKYFQGCKNVLDIGSGRGIFLDLLKENSIGGYGVDANEDLVSYCTRKNLKVEKDDAISHLEKLSDRSLDGIFAAHVIEHLSIKTISDLIRLCYRKLHYGSYAIFVMPNILNITVSSNTFYVDPTHITHVHPNVIKFLMNSSGFRELEEKYYYPIPEEYKMKQILLNNTYDPEESNCLQHEQIDIINHNIDLLNNMLFGCRDYAIIGKK